MKTLKWGILGPGRIAVRFAEAVIGRRDNQELVAVGSRSRDRASEFAKQYRIENVHTDYEALCNDPAVDAIYVATPHAFHEAQARVALESGKSVLIEKPATVSAGEFEGLMDLARQKNLLLMEAMWIRCVPSLKELVSLIQSKSLGNLFRIESNIGFLTSESDEGRLKNPDLAGGALLDMGIYPIALALMMTGRAPLKVHSDMSFLNTGVDGLTSFQMAFSEDIHMQGSCSLVGGLGKLSRLSFEHGTVELPSFMGAQGYSVFRDGEEEPTTVSHPFEINGFEYQIDSFYETWKEGMIECPEIPWEATLAAQKIMDEIRETHGFKYPFEV